jgi:hypothetical protein
MGRNRNDHCHAQTNRNCSHAPPRRVHKSRKTCSSNRV